MRTPFAQCARRRISRTFGSAVEIGRMRKGRR